MLGIKNLNSKGEKMSNIKSGQELRLKNVLKIRREMSQLEIREELNQIEKKISDSGNERNGATITTVYGSRTIKGNTVLDIEILVPLNGPIECLDSYEVLDDFIIHNALHLKHIGNPNMIQSKVNKLNQYINDNNLQATTPLYSINTKGMNTVNSIEEMEVDMYIGVE